MFIFAPTLFSLLQMPIGMETYNSQANPFTLGPNHYPDTPSSLCDLIALRNLFHSIAGTRFSR